MANSVELSLLASGIQNPTAGILSNAAFGVAKTAVPVILAPNGTVATNGTITLGTALPLTYANAWVRLPAAAVSGGAAGLYFVVFSSTTVGQVYTNYADPATAFTPNIPSGTLVAAVGSNSAYTQVTTEVTLANVTIPANAMGANGTVRTYATISNNGTAGAKTLRSKFGGSDYLVAPVTTTLSLDTHAVVANRGVVSSQVVVADGGYGAASATAPTQLAINTADAVAVAITGQVAVATDYLVVEAFRVEIRPAQ